MVKSVEANQGCKGAPPTYEFLIIRPGRQNRTEDRATKTVVLSDESKNKGSRRNFYSCTCAMHRPVAGLTESSVSVVLQSVVL